MNEKITTAMRVNVFRDFATRYIEIKNMPISESDKEALYNKILIDAQRLIFGDLEPSRAQSNVKIDEVPSDIKESFLGKIDNNVIGRLVSIYSDLLKGQQVSTDLFESELRKLFEENYYELVNNSYNTFLSNATSLKSSSSEKNGKIIELAIKHGLNPESIAYLGGYFKIEDGLIVDEREHELYNVIYATPEAINKKIFDSYAEILFYEKSDMDKNRWQDLRKELAKSYISYAKENNINITETEAFEFINNMDKEIEKDSDVKVH